MAESPEVSDSPAQPPPRDCADEPIAGITAEFVGERMGDRVARGQDPSCARSSSSSTARPAVY